MYFVLLMIGSLIIETFLFLIAGAFAGKPLLFWFIFGTIGAFVAEFRGFKAHKALFIGILLGWFAPLIYFSKPVRKKCKNCLKWLELKDKICPFCQHKQSFHVVNWVKKNILNK